MASGSVGSGGAKDQFGDWGARSLPTGAAALGLAGGVPGAGASEAEVRVVELSPPPVGAATVSAVGAAKPVAPLRGRRKLSKTKFAIRLPAAIPLVLSKAQWMPR